MFSFKRKYGSKFRVRGRSAVLHERPCRTPVRTDADLFVLGFQFRNGATRTTTSLLVFCHGLPLQRNKLFCLAPLDFISALPAFSSSSGAFQPLSRRVETTQCLFLTAYAARFSSCSKAKNPHL